MRTQIADVALEQDTSIYIFTARKIDMKFSFDLSLVFLSTASLIDISDS